MLTTKGVPPMFSYYPFKMYALCAASMQTILYDFINVQPNAHNHIYMYAHAHTYQTDRETDRKQDRENKRVAGRINCGMDGRH